MQDLGHPLIPAELNLKVALATQKRETPLSAIGLLGKGWLRQFKLRHPKIATRNSQGLKVNRVRSLYLLIAKTLYMNLEELYMGVFMIIGATRNMVRDKNKLIGAIKHVTLCLFCKIFIITIRKI